MYERKYHKHISARHNWFDLKLNEVWQYRDLIFLFTQKNFTVSYKQTILGPLWLFINPLFGKVYFPRLTVPISNVLCSVIRFGIQMLLVVILLGYYIWKGAVSPHWEALLLIFLLLLWLGCMGMGVGILISSVTTKYRDLSVLVGFGMSLWMYGTPVVYPMSILPEGILKKIILLNPVTAPMGMFRYILLGEGSILPVSIGVSLLFTILVMLGGIVVFNKVERTFMDTV